MDDSRSSLATLSEQLNESSESKKLPTVSDKELQRAAQIQKIVDLLARGRTIEQACDVVGISARTWRRWRKDGYVADVINAKFNDVTSGVKDLVAESLVESTKVLTSLAKGKIPRNTAINGVLAPRDVIAAQQQLMTLWEKLGGDAESKEREQERLLEELANAHISITTVHVDTVNVGSETQPMPIPTGARPAVIEGEIEEADDNDND
jgi:hypothetical protein